MQDHLKHTLVYVIIIYYNANVKKKILLQQQQQSKTPTTLIMKLGQVVFTTRFLKKNTPTC
jgi:hypothetical protein